MISISEIKEKLNSGAYDEVLSRMYCAKGEGLEPYRGRIERIADEFMDKFGCDESREVVICSAPGRTEIGGNHTDHQKGRVLTASVNLDAVACIAPSRSDQVRMHSEGYGMISLRLDSLEPAREERNTAAALLRMS